MAPPASQRGNDLLAMEASIFDEDFTRMVSANHHSRQKYSRHIAFVRLWIHRCLFVEGSSDIPSDRKNSKSGWYPVSANT